MKERPILFSGAMIRAILDGSKTQTRRAVKGMALEWLAPDMFTPAFVASPENDMCPYGKVGDRLWVRETWGVGTRPHPIDGWRDGIEYRADVPYYTDPRDDLPMRAVPDDVDVSGIRAGWRPSIHMPRWASRITLEITDVRVQRLQDISATDAEAEGLTPWSKDGKLTKYGVAESDGLPGTDEQGAWPWHEWRISPIDAYEHLWQSINAKRAPWDSNPWVWAITFERAA